MSKLVKKWWFWVIVIIVLALIIGSQKEKDKATSPYISKYEWSISDTQTFNTSYDNGDNETLEYVMLEVENKDKDLQAGEYNVKITGDNSSTFLLNVTDKTYTDLNNLPVPDVIVNGSENKSIKLEKGNYLYIVKGSTGNGSGKVILEKK